MPLTNMFSLLLFLVVKLFTFILFMLISLTICADMVKNKGFLPSGPSEIQMQRNQLKEIISSLLPACKDADIDSGVSFKADAIIANPPAYGIIFLGEAVCYCVVCLYYFHSFKFILSIENFVCSIFLNHLKALG